MLTLDWHFFPVFDRLDPATAYPGTYNLGLVATSVAIAILAAFVALSISRRIIAATTLRARAAWVSAGAISMGGGIWSMHFIGMLAFSLPCGITYDAVGTLSSMIPGMLASGIALDAISKRNQPGLGRRSFSALLMGAGIAAMHYSGMAAMRPEALLRYAPGLVALSIFVAVALAFVALSIRFQLDHPQSSRTAVTIIAASVMGCAVAGMHYTAMQASIFFPLPDTPTYSMALSPTLLAVLIAMFTVLIAVSTLVATFAGRQTELALSLSAEISRRKRTEEDLRRSEAYLADAQRMSHTGSWAFNVETRQLVHSSEEHHRLFGFDPAGGIPVWDDWVARLHPEDRERTVNTIEQRIHEQRDFEVDYRTIHPDGTLKYVHEVGHPVFSSSGDLVEFAGTSVDVTERTRAEEARRDAQNRLAHANRVAAVGQLTASIAHEINQPITGVVTSGQAALHWLANETPDFEAARRAIERIIRDADRAGEVIGRIRDLIKRAPPHRSCFDLNEAIREVIFLSRGDAMKNGVSVETQFGEGLPLIEGDRVQLQQVILNLIANAVEAINATSEGPRELLVSTAQSTPNDVLVAVKDSGPGLAPTSFEHLFEPFYTTKPGGLGIGLSICRSIIEAHGGRLWATGCKPRGALFQFTILAQRAPAQNAVMASPLRC